MKKHKEGLKILVIILIIIGFCGYKLSKELPKELKKHGLENITQYKNYKTMIEFNYDSGEDFAIAVDDKNKVLTTLCLNDKSTFIGNIKYKNKNYKVVLKNTIKEFNKTKPISKSLNIIIYDKYKLVKSTKKIIKKNNNIKINIKKSKLKTKGKEFKFKDTKESRILINLSIYSQDILNNKNKKSKKTVKLSKEKIKEYADNIYNKLLKYQKSNNIINQDINDNNIKISDIPAYNNLYPDSDSWYYIKDSKVYAYIKFTIDKDIYSFCYQNNSSKEGKC